MRLVGFLVSALLALVPLSVAAQTAAPQQAGDQAAPPNLDKWGITVSGQRSAKGSHIEMSDWRVAETDHVVVYSKGDEKELVRISHNLEKLHFLLSMLLNRVDQPDDTIKLRVLLVGDAADFQAMDLGNRRWQQGPYPAAFPTERYYDPRDDGAVMAAAHMQTEITLKPGFALATLGTFVIDPVTHQRVNSVAGASGAAPDIQVNQLSFKLPAEGRLYAGYAQHYLMTYFPAAYPRWYLDGFGEIFATMSAEQDGVIEYGRAPDGFRQVTDWFGHYPLRQVLDGTYLKGENHFPRWTPYHAWALAHLLFFSDEWKAPLHRYLAAVARGASADEAARALGDLGKLQTALATYHGAKVPFERMTYPPERVTAPIVRQLTASEAEILKRRLELGARVELPPAPPPGADPTTASRISDARRDAIATRDAWVAAQRRNAERLPDELAAQLLLAEAECRSDNPAECLAVADRALALAPESAVALAWKGIALAQLAISGTQAEREAKLREARGYIARANRADTEAPLPLIGYFHSFADAGQAPPDIAVEGLIKASEGVPAAPATRLALGQELARRGDALDARRALLPVADGAYDSPEKPAAKAALAGIRN
ncbi:MAG: hypothetical protein WDN44_13525 [Sphingomonas sp.]